jgi:hypothetical protein
VNKVSENRKSSNPSNPRDAANKLRSRIRTVAILPKDVHVATDTQSKRGSTDSEENKSET